MSSRPKSMHSGTPPRIARGLGAACALCFALSALAQEPPAPSGDQGASPAGTRSLFPLLPSAPSLPSLDVPSGLKSFGHWLEQGTTRFKSDMRGAQDTFDQLGSRTRDAAIDATGAMMGLPGARIVAARERCALAQNGSADCQAAAELLCRGKGFQSGRSLDTQAELKCPAKLLLERRAPNDKDCSTETFVTRAMCQ